MNIIHDVPYVDILTTKLISVILLININEGFQGTGGPSALVLDSRFLSCLNDLKGE
jgi:hypothetical protein